MSGAKQSSSGKVLKAAGISLGAVALAGAILWLSLRGSGSAPQPALAPELQGAPIDAPVVSAVAAPELPEPAPPVEQSAAAKAPAEPEIAAGSVVEPQAATPELAPIEEKLDVAALSVPAAEPAPVAPAAPPAEGAKTADQLEKFAADASKVLADPNKETLDLTFADIASFVYQFPDDAEVKRLGEEKDPAKKKTTRIPENIWALDGRKISIEGFMLPYEVVEGRIKSFVLVKNQMACCFGVMPMMNEWIYVTMAEGKTTDFVPDIPILVTGAMKIGEDVQEGTVVSIYRMDGLDVKALKQPEKDFLSFGF